ncbi:MAG: hypothetical protein FD123_1462 [Bacteroidetes bacterium]|nr:MAG: hypothetical protein FD123_1462 [Bacteroidota bacterium]
MARSNSNILKMRLLLLSGLVFIVIPGPVSAQTGPGGVGSSANNKLWLDANRGTTLAGAAVTAWSDQSGAANNAAPPSVAARPNLVAGTVNGYPSINFDGTDDEFRVTDNASLDLTSWQIYIVVRADVLKNYNAMVVKGDDGMENYEMLSYSDGNVHTPIRWTDATRTFPSSAGGQLTTTGFNILEYSYSAAVGRDVYKNNASIYTDNESKTPAANNFDLYIANERSTAGRFHDGDIAELAIFNAPLNSAQRIIVNNYLSAKYGLTLSANDLYTMDNPANGDFDHDVAGIGRVSAANIQSDSRGSGAVRVNNPSGLGNNEYFMWGHNNGTWGSWGVADLPVGIQSRLAREWRPSETGDVGTIDIGFDLSNLGPITTSDLRLLIDTDNDGVFSDETAGGGGVISGASLVGGLYYFTGINMVDSRRFTIGSINSTQTPLPVEFTEFNAVMTDGQVQINWTTASEVNNDYFEIERSKNGTDFEVLGRVEGAGNSTVNIDYFELDAKPYEGTSYYRIRQVDFNGESSRTKIVAVNLFYDKKKGIMTYPNPSTIEDLKIELTGFKDEEVLVVLRDIKGNEIATKMQFIAEGATIIGLDPGRTVAPGTYLVVASSKNELFTQKVVIR